MTRLTRNQRLALVLIATLVGVFSFAFPTQIAQAGPVDAIMGWLNSLIFEVAGKFIYWAAKLLDYFVANQPVRGILVVDASWRIIRDFVNMFFILVLIIMAFGTLFGIQGYTWREMLRNFLIVAILINFSLPIGQYIAETANGLSSVFLKQMAGLSENLAQGLELGQISTLSGPSNVFTFVNASASTLVTFIFSIVFTAMALFAMVVAAIYSVVRLIAIWLLLIVSPIAWFGYMLPTIKSETWSLWWKHFLCWCFSLPAYLFFLMFAVIFIKNKNQASKFLPPTVLDPNNAFGSIFSGSSALTDLMFYGLTIAFMIGGLGAAFKVCKISGSLAEKSFTKISGRVKRTVGYSALERGVKQAHEKMKEEGGKGIFRPFYGRGERGERLKAAGVAGFLVGGRAGRASEMAKAQQLEVNKELENIRQALHKMEPEKIQEFLRKEMEKSGIRGLAATLEHAKQGYAKFGDYEKAMGRFGGEYSVLGREYLKNLKEAKFSNLFQNASEELAIAKGEEVAGAKTEPFKELRRALAQDLAEKDRITNPTDFNDFRNLVKDLPKEHRAFMNAIKPEVVYGTKEKRQDALRNSDTDSDLALKLINFMKEKKEIDSTDLLYRVLERLGNKTLGSGEIGDGKETIEGRNVINEINKFNPIITTTMDVRLGSGLAWDKDLTEDNLAEITKRVSDIIGNKEDADIRKMDKKFFQDPIFKEAAKTAFSAERVGELLKGAPNEMRKAIKDIAEPPRIVTATR